MAKKSRHTDPKPKSIGRPEKPIDWERVDILIVAGCNANQIAPNFNMTDNTFCRRLEEKYGVNFSTYASQMAPKGESLILEKQLEKALKGAGDNTMLVWLGKIRCGQRETTSFEVDENALEAFKTGMAWLNQEQEKRKLKRVIDENKS